MRLRYVPPLSLPHTTTDRLEREHRACVWVAPPGTGRSGLRDRPAFIDDPAGTGMLAHLGADTYSLPPAFLTALPAAMLFGYRAMAWDGHFCTDEAGTDGDETARFLAGLGAADPFPNEDTGLRPAADGDGFELDADSRPRRYLDGTMVVLCSHEPSNYGSFLFRVLPKLHLVRSLGLAHLPMVVWAKTPAFAELLGLCGLDPAQVVQHETHMITNIDHALAPSLRNPHAFLDAESHAMFQELATAHGGGGPRRIYVSRSGYGQSIQSRSRRMINEGEVEAALQRLDFTVIQPERLTPAEQIATFAAADIVVGPAGSGMFNVVFCRPGTKVVDIESEPHWIYAHTGLFASCELRFGLFIGEVDASDPTPIHRRFQVDVPALTQRVAEFLRT